MLEYFISALVTLLVVFDPVGLAPTFLAITEGLPASARKQVAIRACIIAALLLAGASLIGDSLLGKLGISLPAFRIAGGLLLFSIAYEMVFGLRIPRQKETAEAAVEKRVRNIAAFPLGIPLMAGPGAMTASILLAGRANNDPKMLGLLLLVVVLVVLSCLVVFLMANRISKLLGITGSVVLSRLLGVLVAALAVQFVADGVRALMKA